MIHWLRKRWLARKLYEERLLRRERRQEEQTLLSSLMQLENTRLQQQIEADKHRAELDLKRIQWELENAAQLAEAKATDARVRAELLATKRESMREARAAKKAQQAQSRQMETGECRVCKGNATDLRAEEITWHYNGHNYGPSLLPNNG